MTFNNWSALATSLATYVPDNLPHLARGALRVCLPGAAPAVRGIFVGGQCGVDLVGVRRQLREAGDEVLGEGESEDKAVRVLVIRAVPPGRPAEERP